ncbi:MAG TPA: carboxypeptidase-like regulatory domain-containing protein [Kofleriaceae bacterium]|nr:carboxypeptidase-like regulatory domain-containing protein [Kofleriaceae bacterium]
MIRASLSLALVGLAACGSLGNEMNPDGPLPGDAGGCSVMLSYTTPAYTGQLVTVTSTVDGAFGVPTYSWQLTFGGTAQSFTTAPDGTSISFTPAVAGVYTATLDLSGPTSCPEASTPINVMVPGGNTANYRLHVVPAPSVAPPQEQIIVVHGGADFDQPIALMQGLSVGGMVSNGATGVPAYLKFMPVATPDAYVETFSASDGTFTALLLGQSHQVLIVPEVSGLAPILATWQPGTGTLPVGPGTTIDGTVKDGGGAAVAGATVQLSSGGVPSTLATTAADGSFTIHAAFTQGAQVTVDVTPPAGRGLPRLSATAAFTLTSSLQIKYASLATCDLGGVAIQRGGANQANAQLVVVGTLAAVAGTVTWGAAANATGTVQIAASADATGKLPSTLAPRAQLSAVVRVAGNDVAVSSIDLTTCPGTAIDAPAQTTVAGTITDATKTIALSGARVEATPTGALAQAGQLAVETTANGSGAFSIALATGGTYDVRFVDPMGRGAPLVENGVTAAGVATAPALPKALHVSGLVSVAGAGSVVGASIQILCAACTGIDATVPIAETATDATSHFETTVPDPGVE